MSFSPNQYQQLHLDDKFNFLSDREKRILENSWAKGFADIIFPAINEERFAVLYSTNSFSRPNTPVNVVVSALLLKEMCRLTDDELLASILFDTRFQYALHTTSFKEQPFSDRTLSRFREKLYRYELETGIDLIKEEMENLATYFVKFLKINPSIKRMDSVMVSSSCKKMSRLEIMYTCVGNLVNRLNADKRTDLIPPNLSHYLNEEDKNNTLYRSKTEEVQLNLEKAISDAAELLSICEDTYSESEEYRTLKRALEEQACFTAEGAWKPKDKKEIRTDSLQNPSDPDATFRRKAGETHKGYVGNFVETVDEHVAIITQFGYEQNIHNDSAFCKEVVDELGMQESPVTLIADGAYGGTEATSHAKENNIELITTTLLGKDPNAVQGEFVIDEIEHQVVSCPAGHLPVQSTYNPKVDSYRVLFLNDQCNNCPNKEACKVKNQKKHAVLTISTKTVARAQYLKKLSTEEYKKLTRMRNAVEGIPSVLRRRYHVDQIPVRGLLCSKIWFFLKLGAMNVKRVLANASSPVFLAMIKSIVKIETKIRYLFGLKLSFQLG